MHELLKFPSGMARFSMMICMNSTKLRNSRSGAPDSSVVVG